MRRGGLREAVLTRDGYGCRVFGAFGRGKRLITVHHRVPGRSVLRMMISLCPGCHAKVHQTRVGRAMMAPLLLELGASSTRVATSSPILTSEFRRRRKPFRSADPERVAR